MAKLTPVILDYETYWDSNGHTLSKMNPIDYVMHPETEIISCAAKVGDEPTYVTFGEENIRKQMQNFDWSDKIVIAHNNEGFDAMITAWRMGVRPKMWGCTLAMARPIHAKSAGGSLRALAEHYGLQHKGDLEKTNTKGKHLRDFTQEEIAAMREYNKIDTDICAALFKILLPLTSKDEMRLIDMTIRMLVEPQFVVDTELLEGALADERARKHLLLLDTATIIGADVIGKTDDEVADEIAKTLGSAAKFAKLLTDLGVDPPMKISPTTGKETYALAKTDEAFTALTTHQDPIVAAAASARLGVKSSILETRIEAFLAAGAASGGRLPVPLKYYGADTTGRWSGWGYNPQNLPRVSGKPSDCLRNSLRAPKGYKVVVADLSGIELRVNHFLWKVPSSMALFKADPEKADLYKEFASGLYGVERSTVTKDQRQVGKVAHLGLGFGAGAATFTKVAKLMAGITLSQEEAQKVVTSWREAYREIVAGWKSSHGALGAIYQGAEQQIDPWGMCYTTAEGIRTPKGLIRYPNLRQEATDEGKTEWVYGEGRNKARIYAGKVTENVVQHLARCVIADNALEIKRSLGLSPALMVHDELVYIVPEAKAGDTLTHVQAFMRTPPDWWPELITWSAGDIADSYGEAK